MVHFRSTVASLLALSWLQLVSAATGDGGCNIFFCTNITVEHDMMIFEVKPIHEPFGWLGLGWGRQMTGTQMVIMWDKDDGSRFLSHRYATSEVEPLLEPNPPRVATQIEPRPTTKWDYKTLTDYAVTAFKIPLNMSDPYPGTMIWAYGTIAPDREPNANLTQHYVAGTINMKLNKHIPGTALDDTILGGSTGGSSFFPKYEKEVWHGILLSTGFLVLLPGGSLIARWGRTFTPRWFKVHRALNFYLALPIISFGWVLGPLAVEHRQGSHFSEAHHICGAALFGIYLFQVFLGRFIHSKHSTPNRSPHPPTNILHVFIAIVLISLAFFQVRSGISEYAHHNGQAVPSTYVNAWAAWAFALPLLYFGGMVMLKKQFAQESKGDTYADTPNKNYIALATTPAFDHSEHDVSSLTMRNYDAELESGVPLLARGP